MFGDLNLTGDATADLGKIGNYNLHVDGFNIARVELTFSNDVTGNEASDPQYRLYRPLFYYKQRPTNLSRL